MSQAKIKTDLTPINLKSKFEETKIIKKGHRLSIDFLKMPETPGKKLSSRKNKHLDPINLIDISYTPKKTPLNFYKPKKKPDQSNIVNTRLENIDSKLENIKTRLENNYKILKDVSEEESEHFSRERNTVSRSLLEQSSK